MATPTVGGAFPYPYSSKKSPQSCLQASVTEVFSQLRLCSSQICLGLCQVDKNNQHNTPVPPVQGWHCPQCAGPSHKKTSPQICLRASLMVAIRQLTVFFLDDSTLYQIDKQTPQKTNANKHSPILLHSCRVSCCLNIASFLTSALLVGIWVVSNYCRLL